jgi:hypothetical protein
MAESDRNPVAQAPLNADLTADASLCRRRHTEGAAIRSASRASTAPGYVVSRGAACAYAVKPRGRELPYFSKLGLGHVLREDPVVVQGGRALRLDTRSVADGSNARSCL